MDHFVSLHVYACHYFVLVRCFSFSLVELQSMGSPGLRLERVKAKIPPLYEGLEMRRFRKAITLRVRGQVGLGRDMDIARSSPLLSFSFAPRMLRQRVRFVLRSR